MGQFKLQQWQRAKVVELDYDFLAALENKQCEYCLSDVTVQLCIALLATAEWKTRYFSDLGTDINQDTIQNWADTAQKELMPCSNALPQPTQTYDPDGHLLFDPGNGLPPYNADTFDPRFNSPTAPPPTTDDPDCTIAGNVRQTVKDFRDQIYNLLNTSAAFFAIVGAVISIIALIVTGFTAAPLVIAFVGAVIGISAADFIAAIGDSQLDSFACLIYCQLQTHVSPFEHLFVASDYDALLGEINDRFTGIQIVFFRGWTILAGIAGLQNAGAAGDGFGFDCSDCTCPGCTELLGAFDNTGITAESFSTAPPATYDDSVPGQNHYQGTFITGDTGCFILLTIATDNTRPIISINMGGSYTRFGGGSDPNSGVLGYPNWDDTNLATVNLPIAGIDAPYALVWSGSITTSQIQVLLGIQTINAIDGDGIGLGAIEICYG